MYPLATMEAVVGEGEEPDEARIDGGAGVEIGHKWERPLVELRRPAHEPGFSEVLLRPDGTRVTARSFALHSMCFMNRRMRNRMSGGVGGRRG